MNSKIYYLYVYWTKTYIKNSQKFFFVFFVFSRAVSMAYGGYQARGLIRALASGLCQSHNNAVSKPHLQPTPQLMATPDPQPTEQAQGLNLQPPRS